MSYSIRFRLRKQNFNEQTGLTPLYCRLSINSVFCSDFYIGVRIDAQKWDSKRQIITGSNRECLQDNQRLENIRTDIKALINAMCEGETVHDVKSKYCDKVVQPPTLLQAFRAYIDTEKIGSSIQPDALKKWEKSYYYLSTFVRANFRLDEIDGNFSRRYYKHLVSVEKLSNNQSIRNVSYLSTVLKWCVIEGYTNSNRVSTDGMKRTKKSAILYLSDKDVKTLENLQVSGIVEQCRDLFLFGCYTSLDNNEIKRLGQIDNEETFLKVSRGKVNGSLQIVPIIPKARAILEKYAYRLPVLDTYTITRNIKVLASFLTFAEPLGMKVARRTSGMFFLSSGVPLDVVSRILGHASVKTTQKYYANILDEILILKHTKNLL